MMQKQANKWVLVLVTLALMASPLRGSWAMPAQDMASTGPNCAQMQGNPVLAFPAGSLTDNQCNGCCDDDCNNMDCNSYTFAATAISNIHTALPITPVSQASTNFVYYYPERTIIPPLRPPVSL